MKKKKKSFNRRIRRTDDMIKGRSVPREAAEEIRCREKATLDLG